jgi:hypothetical protein
MECLDGLPRLEHLIAWQCSGSRRAIILLTYRPYNALRSISFDTHVLSAGLVFSTPFFQQLSHVDLAYDVTECLWDWPALRSLTKLTHLMVTIQNVDYPSDILDDYCLPFIQRLQGSLPLCLEILVIEFPEELGQWECYNNMRTGNLDNRIIIAVYNWVPTLEWVLNLQDDVYGRVSDIGKWAKEGRFRIWVDAMKMLRHRNKVLGVQPGSRQQNFDSKFVDN